MISTWNRTILNRIIHGIVSRYSIIDIVDNSRFKRSPEKQPEAAEVVFSPSSSNSLFFMGMKLISKILLNSYTLLSGSQLYNKRRNSLTAKT